ncbi:MAG: Electron transfer flavoprotein subunit alpha [Alphaproteobacteria bacterium MarineAlpha3_Bin5]|nr:electron transfer flavoprotein subunit alpha [Magnetovibrio sp.]PPR74911.1 MAG: Electron transfer flavoprotein subunit alpha [Alphaproteobacteria bacterium MarineAlpha3_Bin5]
MNVLVIAEHENGEIKDLSLSAVSAGTELGKVNVLIAGHNCRPAAEKASKLRGVSQVLLADAPVYENWLAENLALLISSIAKNYTHLIMTATTVGKNIMPRVAAKLDVAQISDITQIQDNETFVRPIYAGNAMATVQSLDQIKVLTVRATAFEPISGHDDTSGIQLVSPTENVGVSAFIDQEVTKSERPELTSARIVISGGRGMQSGENFAMLEEIADKLGGAVGASRAAVDSGFVPNEYQVGQTGKVVAPDLYIAVGISGAIQHLAGMKDSKVIVAINKDEEAPIFQVADYGLVADLFEAVPSLSAELEN